MHAVIRLAQKRRSAGKDSVFTVRGRPFELRTAILYFQRKGISIDDMSANVPESDEAIGANRDVRCITPTHTANELSVLQKAPQDVLELHQLESILVNIPRAIDAFVSRVGVSNVAQPIEYYHTTTDAVRGWWDMPRNILCSGSQRSFDFPTVEHVCKVAYSELKDRSNICIVLDVMAAVWSEAAWRRPALVHHFLAYICQMSRAVLGEKHPFAEIFSSLYRVREMLELTNGQLMECTIKGLSRELGRLPDLRSS